MMKILIQMIREEFATVNKDSDGKLNLTLLYGSFVLFIYCYFGSYSFFEQTFADVPDLAYWKIIYHHCMNFLLFFCCGLIFIKFVLRRPLRDYGLSFGEKKLSLLFILFAIPFSVLSGVSGAGDEQLRAAYPLVNLHEYGTWQFVLGYYVSYFLYYIGWEFFFRGLLLNASKRKMGVVAAILFTTMISALIHTSIASMGKPMIETLSAIPAGIMFGYIAYKTRSMIPPLIIHTLIGFSTDFFNFIY